MKNKDCCHEKQHPDHSKELSRLNRISGQIEGIKRMIEERRYCPDILTQLRAIRSAIRALEGNILEIHLGSCVTDAGLSKDKKEKQKKLAELVELFKRFD